MKKLILCLSILSSVAVFANAQEDKIEMELMKQYPTLTDGTTSINVHKYDVDLDHHKIELKVELKGENIESEFNKLEKAKLETVASEMAKYTQTESGKKLPVELEIELDKDLEPDQTLYKNIF
ncbi:hypothetical protein [Cetobacterium sp. SF1]|uniref:hypothetical protein n=1 Tax=unclassified Cetobacterium TaxID=2630983 RepID=UPI003CECE6E7